MGVYLLIHIVTLAQKLWDMNLLHAFLVVEIVLLGSSSSNVIWDKQLLLIRSFCYYDSPLWKSNLGNRQKSFSKKCVMKIILSVSAFRIWQFWCNYICMCKDGGQNNCLLEAWSALFLQLHILHPSWLVNSNTLRLCSGGARFKSWLGH